MWEGHQIWKNLRILWHNLGLNFWYTWPHVSNHNSIVAYLCHSLVLSRCWSQSLYTSKTPRLREWPEKKDDIDEKKYQMWVKRHKRYFKTQSSSWFNIRYYNQFGFENIVVRRILQTRFQWLSGLGRRYVYDCCGATQTSPCWNLLRTYVKERLLPSKKEHSNRMLWVLEFVS